MSVYFTHIKKYDCPLVLCPRFLLVLLVLRTGRHVREAADAELCQVGDTPLVKLQRLALDMRACLSNICNEVI